MNSPLKYWLLLCVLTWPLAGKEKEETLIPFGDHRIAIAVPDGFTYNSSKDEHGVIVAALADQKQKISLKISFLPDPSARLGLEETQKSFVAELSQPYAEGSVEKSYDFKPLAPRVGSGLYCAFTDASLVGKMPFPPNEFLMITSGVKVWSGCAAIFQLWSNDATSKEYQAAMKVLRESVQESPVPIPGTTL